MASVKSARITSSAKMAPAMGSVECGRNARGGPASNEDAHLIHADAEQLAQAEDPMALPI